MVLENKKHVVPRLDYFENQGVMTGSKEFPRVDHMIDEFRYKLETVGESIKGHAIHTPLCFPPLSQAYTGTHRSYDPHGETLCFRS